MNADMRGFRYPLAAVLQVRQWRIERLLRSLAVARTALAELERQQGELDQARAQQAAATGDAWKAAPDPAGRQQMLGYLAGLKTKQLNLRADHAAACTEIEALKLALQDEQVGLRALEEHRGGVHALFALAQRQAQDAAADASWLTGSLWRQRDAGGSRQ